MNPRAVPFLAAILAGCAEDLPSDRNPDLERRFMASARPLQVVLVLDITNSWTQANFAEQRAAAVGFLDVLIANAGPDDLVGMVVATGRYGVEHTPMVPIVDAVGLGVRDDWEELRTASKAGIQQPNGNCAVFPYNNSRYPAGAPYPTNEFGLSSNTLNNSSWPMNTFSSVEFLPQAPRTTQTEADEDGCYPNMWREYLDESGTDQANGIAMATTMFRENADPFAYKAMVLMTDGQPNGTGAHAQRDAAGYVDTRWRSVRGPSRTTNDVIVDTQRFAARAWDRYQISTWMVSFVDTAPWFAGVAQGDGTFMTTTNATDLPLIYEDIARSLPE